MVRIRRGWVIPVVLSAFFSLLIPQHSRIDAQAGAGQEILTMNGFGEPVGPVTASHLRMHQPLYVLDQVRQVRAGTLDPQLVAPLVGGDGILATLLTRDLDGLLGRLTGPEDSPTGPHPSPWRRILTDDGAASLPPLDPLAPVQFAQVVPGDSPSQIVRVTSPIDGVLEASLPAGAFRVNALRALDGVIDNSVPMFRGDFAADLAAFLRWLAGPVVRSQYERAQSPLTIPVRAGQDVEIEVGLTPGTTVPAAGLNSELTIRDGAGSGGILWNVGVAALPLDSNIYIFVSGANLKPLQLTHPVVIQTNANQPFLVPMIVANPSPPSLVQGTVQLVSGPAGLSMTPVNFTLQPGGQSFLFPTLNIVSGSQAATTFVSQPFSLRVSYDDVPILNAGSQTFGLHYTVYPESRYWQTSASAQGVNCFRNITAFATGKYASFGQCDNINFYQAVTTETSTLGSLTIAFNDKTYFQANTVKAGWTSGSFNPSAYPNLLAQKLAAKWSVCTPSFVFC